MSRSCKLLSKLLTATIIASCMQSMVLAKQDKQLAVKQTETITKEDKIANIIGENSSKRGKYSKEFINDDGTFQSVVYPIAVSYMENGQWKDIDNSLVDQNGSLQNKSNNFKVKLSKDPKSDNLISISEDKYELSWGLENSQGSQYKISQKDENKLNDSINKLASEEISSDKNLSKKSDKEKSENKGTIVNNEKKLILSNATSGITYLNILPNTDLNYNLMGSNLKENIVLNKPSQNPEFKFYIYAKNLQPKLNSDNSISLYDEKNQTKPVFKIQSPIMYDSKKHISNKIEVSLNKLDGKYELILKPDNDWLNSKSTTYPVTIDPPVQSDFDYNSIYSTMFSYVSENLANTNFSSDVVVCTGTDPYYYGKTRSYVNFNLPSLSSSQNITSAYFSMEPWSIDDVGPQNEVDIHKVLSQWDGREMTWNNQPQYDTSVVDYQIVKNDMLRYTWDITKIAKDWYSNGGNFGLMLDDATDETFIEWITTAYGNDSYLRPELTLNYNNTSGLESYWSYHSQNIGRAGTGYVNDYSGNLVLIHNDLNMNGNRMPINLNHVYDNSNASNNKGFGNGWITNFNQTVKPLNINNETWYEYSDDDGTKHYFKYDSGSNSYVDELGLGFTLIQNADGTYTITGKDNNKLNFNSSGYLTSLTDQNNNQITIKYNGASISTITDGTGRVVTLNYTVDGKLDNINDPSSRKTQFVYTNNQLTGIVYPDGKQTTYKYDSNNNLKSAINYDGYKIDYTYYNAVPYRMWKIEEGNTDGTKGGELDINYDYNMSIFTDINKNKEVYQFNDSGNVVGIRDNQGNGQYYKYGSSVNPTKFTVASKLQGTIINYLQDHNAEIGGYWIEDGTESQSQYSLSSANYTSEEKYLGSKSLMVSKNTADGRHYLKETITLQPGKTYTLSSYIKTADISNIQGTGAGISIGYYDKNNVYQTIDSKLISGSNDWNRIELCFTLPSDAKSGTVYAEAGIVNATGTAYYDCLQLEDGSIANRYNLVENPSFEYGTGTPNFWNVNSGDARLTNEKTIFGSNSIKVSSLWDNIVDCTITQNIKVSGKQNDAFVVGGWALGNSIPLTTNRDFGIKVDLVKSGAVVQSQTISFNQAVKDWQYICDSVIANSDFDSINISATYNNNCNQVYFDGIQLYKEEFGINYNYDSKGNLVSDSNPGSVGDNYQYTNNDLVKQSSSDGSSTSLQYDSNHNLTNETSGEGVTSTFTHDSFGNETSSKIGNDTFFIKESNSYTPSGNYIYSQTDSLGYTTTMSYDETKGLLKSVVDPENATTSYAYDNNTDQLKSVSVYAYGTQVTNSYGYENDRLKSITTHNGVNYSFGYDSLGRNSSVSVGAQNLITNNYEASTGNLLSSIYGNGQKLSYDYDSKGMIIAQKYNDNIINTYEYNSEGNLGFKHDVVNNISYWYFYDLQGNLARVVDSKGNEQNFQKDYSNNRTTTKETIIQPNNTATTYTTNYTNNKDSNPNQVVMNSGAKLDYSYDSLSRLTGKTLSTGAVTFNTIFNYMPGANGSQSSQIESIDNNGDKISYTYYKDGNIDTITRNSKQIKYYYNNLKEVTREDNQETGKTIIYAYDLGGNLTSRKEYLYNSFQSLTRIVLYQYTDSNWKDKLTSFDGKAITYDSIGNPLTYDGYSYTWENGRQLKSISKNDQNTNLNISFKYNDSGIRTEKTVNGVTNTYHLNGDKVTFETDGTNNIYYTYDSNNSPVSMSLNGVEYYYVKNAQGDIIGLLDNTGTKVASYTYDTWGKLISITGSLKDSVGQLNPYRYRGYRYDSETGLYYLQSRYYNPEWGRFINSDDMSILQMRQGQVLGTNLFAYCSNNFVNMSDSNGYWSVYLSHNTLYPLELVLGISIATLSVYYVIASLNYYKVYLALWFSAFVPSIGTFVGIAVTVYISYHIGEIANALYTDFFWRKGVDVHSGWTWAFIPVVKFDART